MQQDSDSAPQFILRESQSYQPDEETILVVCTVERQGEGNGEVEIRAKLSFRGTRDWVQTRTFGVPDEYEDERTLAVAFSDDSSNFDHSFTAEAKLLGDSAVDTEWVEETD